jgi:CheY-like chemotaxis protein
MTVKRILSVGQCGADHDSIARTLGQLGAEVVAAHSHDEALGRLRREAFALVLVNRILDRDGSSGLDLIREVKSDEQLAGVPVMLVSNHADAQEEACEAGAEPGFGKSALYRAETLECVRRCL